MSAAPRDTGRVPLDLVKYHGLGNDFLVLVDPDRQRPFTGDVARSVCDRHRGVGADGLIRLSMADELDARPSISMDLLNADGSPAETSGNGLRCAALAAVDELREFDPRLAMVDSDGQIRFSVVTAAGRSDVAVRRARATQTASSEPATVRVSMGTAHVREMGDAGALALGPLSDAQAKLDLEMHADARAYGVDVGNPHLVVVDPVREPLVRVALDHLGPGLESAVPGGVNVEVVVPTDGGARLLLDVWERGAGLTLACGSGSCAAAAAARAAGRVGDVVHVDNPGGTVQVELFGPLECPDVTLTGPAQRIAAVSVEDDVFQRTAGPRVTPTSGEASTDLDLGRA